MFSIIPKIFSPGKKIGFTCHGQDWQRARWNWIARKILKLGEKTSAVNTDFRIMVSNDLKRYYRKAYGVQSICLYNGATAAKKVNLDKLTEKFGLEKDRYFLFVGRLVPEKAPHILIQAFNQIATNFKLVIVGDSPETPEYVSYLKGLAQNNPNIIFTSYLQGEEKAEAYSNALAYVSSSTLEGHPITALEAMAYALPILVSDIPPHSEILAFYPENYLPSFRVNDVYDCRRALLKVCELSLRQLKRIGEQSQSVILEFFDWDTITEATKGVYLSAVRSQEAYLYQMQPLEPVQKAKMAELSL